MGFPASLPSTADRQQVEAAAFVLSLRSRGFRDTAVLGAMERVPRDLFAPRRFADLARTDVSLPLACGQTMTAPAIVAAMLVALGVGPGQRVLEIGTGSGYVTALLARLAGHVTSIERFGTLATEAGQRLAVAGLADRILLETGDGLAPRAHGARFDRVLVNGALASQPAALTSLVAPGGRLVGAVAAEGGPRLLRLERGADGALHQELGSPLRLSPLAAGRAAAL
jgi:protein-L-isoaspartate(D-aspartate) O-methyltransferase